MLIKNQDYLRRRNQSLVLKMVLEHGPISRAEIAKKTMMSPTSASRIVTSLLKEGLIREKKISTSQVGRKAIYFVPNEDYFISFGVEIDVNRISIGMINFVGEWLEAKSFYCDTASSESVINVISDTIHDMLKRQKFSESKIIRICVGLPGIIDIESGVVQASAQLNWRDIPLKKLLEARLPYEVQIENELNLKALAEYEAFQSTYGTVAIIGFGKGVGSSVIVNGDIFRGAHNYSGEIGHTTVDPYGVYCPCGNFGCLQTYIAEQFLISEASKTRTINSVNEIIRYYERDEKWAQNIIDKALIYMGVAINNVVCTYNPEVVVLSGSLIENYSTIRDLILETYKENIWKPLLDSFELKITNTRNKGVVMGAALNLQQHFIDNFDEKGD